MREVTDILSFDGAPIAFLQISLTEYRIVCPWCTDDIGHLTYASPTDFGTLYYDAFTCTQAHMPNCTKQSATQIDVHLRGRQN